MNGMNDKELQELTEESEEISAEYKSDETELDAQDGTGSSDEDEDEEEKSLSPMRTNGHAALFTQSCSCLD